MSSTTIVPRPQRPAVDEASVQIPTINSFIHSTQHVAAHMGFREQRGHTTPGTSLQGGVCVEDTRRQPPRSTNCISFKTPNSSDGLDRALWQGEKRFLINRLPVPRGDSTNSKQTGPQAVFSRVQYEKVRETDVSTVYNGSVRRSFGKFRGTVDEVSGSFEVQ